MTVWDRGAETGTGRWHVRLRHSTFSTVQFEDFQATSVQDAIDQANTQFPDFLVEWAIREPDRYGVFFNSGPRE